MAVARSALFLTPLRCLYSRARNSAPVKIPPSSRGRVRELLGHFSAGYARLPIGFRPIAWMRCCSAGPAGSKVGALGQAGGDSPRRGWLRRRSAAAVAPFGAKRGSVAGSLAALANRGASRAACRHPQDIAFLGTLRVARALALRVASRARALASPRCASEAGALSLRPSLRRREIFFRCLVAIELLCVGARRGSRALGCCVFSFFLLIAWPSPSARRPAPPRAASRRLAQRAAREGGWGGGGRRGPWSPLRFILSGGAWGPFRSFSLPATFFSAPQRRISPDKVFSRLPSEPSLFGWKYRWGATKKVVFWTWAQTDG